MVLRVSTSWTMVYRVEYDVQAYKYKHNGCAKSALKGEKCFKGVIKEYFQWTLYRLWALTVQKGEEQLTFKKG